MSEFKLDIIEPNISFSLEEKADEVDGKHVLAKIKGEFFVPDGHSRNKRFYPKSLWEKVLKSKDVKERLKNRTMFGAISHSTPINDESLRDGKFSHIVTKMYIDENGKGIGEALILNTPSGRILNTIARAGSKLFVSTRADGSYKGETSEGVPIVDEDSYKYHTTDFVLQPGFLEANPSLAEEFKNLENIKENEMEKALKVLTEENGNLKVDLAELGSKLEEAKINLVDAVEENTTLKGENDRLLKEVEELKTVKEELENANKLIKAYEDIDAPEYIERAIKTASTIIESYREFGTIEEVAELLEANETMVEKIAELGGLDTINTIITASEAMVEKIEAEKTEKEIEALAEELKVSKERIAKVYEKLSVEEIKDIFANIEEEAKKEEIKEEIKEDDSDDFKEDIKEEADIEDKTPTMSRAASLMESFSKGF